MPQDPKPDDRARQDEWLVVRCQLGERPAFDAPIERWHAPLWRYVRLLTSNVGVAQEVWLRVIEREAGKALLGNAVNFPGPLLCRRLEPIEAVLHQFLQGEAIGTERFMLPLPVE